MEETPWGFDPPWRGNPYNPDLELALTFLAETAARYRDRPWVLYSVFNEPAFISWSDWRPLAERLVDAVRDQHPGALVLVSGVHWASELDGALADPVRREGVVYEIHPYPWVGESWKRVVTELSMTHPVFLGEWGFGDEHPASERNYGEALVGYCEEMGLGWTAWIWDHSWTPSMFTSRSRARLTPFGALVKRVPGARQGAVTPRPRGRVASSGRGLCPRTDCPGTPRPGRRARLSEGLASATSVSSPSFLTSPRSRPSATAAAKASVGSARTTRSPLSANS